MSSSLKLLLLTLLLCTQVEASDVCRFGALLETLVTKHAADEGVLEAVAESDRPVNPIDFVTGLKGAVALPFRRGFDDALRTVDWELAREVARKILRDRGQGNTQREEASAGTREIASIKVVETLEQRLASAAMARPIAFTHDGREYVAVSTKEKGVAILALDDLTTKKAEIHPEYIPQTLHYYTRGGRPYVMFRDGYSLHSMSVAEGTIDRKAFTYEPRSRGWCATDVEIVKGENGKSFAAVIEKPNRPHREGMRLSFLPLEGRSWWPKRIKLSMKERPRLYSSGSKIAIVDTDGGSVTFADANGRQSPAVALTVLRGRDAVLFHGDHAFLSTPEGVAQVDTTTGNVLRTTSIGSGEAANLKLVDGRLYAMATHQMTAIDPANGKVLHTISAEDRAGEVQTFRVNGSALIAWADRRGRVTIADAETGVMLTRQTIVNRGIDELFVTVRDGRPQAIAILHGRAPVLVDLVKSGR